jgi:hypothetical protein
LPAERYRFVVAALDLIDLARYPITDLDSPRAREVIDDARRQIAELGAAELTGFVTEAGVKELVRDAEELQERAHLSGGIGTAYLELPSDDWPSEHPRQTWMPYAVRAVGYDVIPYDSALRQIYELEALTRFIEAVLDRGELFHYADPCGALNLAVMADGDQLQWHFDQTDFVVSLAIQGAERGGDFDVVPRIRSADAENYDHVGAVLGGDHSSVLTLAMTPGTLLIFEGRNSLHRVSPIEGERLRHVGLLAYDTKATTTSSQLLREIRYGRAEAFATPPLTWPAS